MLLNIFISDITPVVTVAEVYIVPIYKIVYLLMAVFVEH